MASEVEIEKVIQEVMEFASEQFNDTRRFTQSESHDLWYGLSSEAGTWANTIRDEMEPNSLLERARSGKSVYDLGDVPHDSDDIQDPDDASDEEH